MAVFQTTISGFANGRIEQTPEGASLVVQRLPFVDWFEATFPNSFPDANVTIITDTVTGDVTGGPPDGGGPDGRNEPFVPVGTRLQQILLDTNFDGIPEFQVLGQNPSDFDVRSDNVSGDNIGLLNGTFRVFDLATGGSVGPILSTGNLYIASDGSFPPPGGREPIVDPGSGTFVICFASGTRIQTPCGEIPVEELSPGDAVLTRNGKARPLVWTARRRMDRWALQAAPHLRPVRLAAGVLSNRRDLVLSPEHRVVLSGALSRVLFGRSDTLIAAGDLLSFPGVTRCGGEPVTYHHIACAEHEIILAEGAQVEAFQPTRGAANALDARVRQELQEIFPELTADCRSAIPAALPRLTPAEAQIFMTASQRLVCAAPLRTARDPAPA